MEMASSSGTGDYGIFDELAEEFAERYRRGERPSLQEYVDRCPAMGDEIRELFPALVEVEQAEEVLDPRHGSTVSTSAPALRQVGDYRVIREVGRGGMGVVYEAEQVSLGRRVALKILPGVVAKDRKSLERFRREARAAARLHHTNIVPVFEVGQDGEVVFYAMQFIQGQGLEVVIDELARQRQKSGHGSAAKVAAAAEEQKPGPLGSTLPERTAALSRSPASLPVHDRTEALAASLRARQVSRMAQSLVTGTFAVELVDPDRTGSSNGVEATDVGDSQPSAAASMSPPSSSSAVLPGGTQVSAVESSGKRLPFFRSVAQIGRQAAQGLAYAHARGVIHRDIKPSNLLLDSAGVVWIADFGLAKADDDGLTATGDILGTLRYMAPERFRGEGDLRADVYALGLTLYELLTLRPGFESSDRLQMIERIKAEEPVRPRLLDNRIPRDLETIVLKAIDKDPDRRYPTADAMAEDLRRYLDDEPVLARRTTAVERYARWARRNPGIAVLGGVLTAVLLLVTAASLIVAGNMKRLATERGAAALEAERARGQEADQRALAEKAQREAEASAKEADAQRRRAEASFAQARSAVDESFTKISESQLLKAPGMQPLRRELLQSALAFNEGFLKERGDDPTVRAELASAFLRAGKIHKELSDQRSAKVSFEKARELFETLAAANPGEPEFAHGLADSLYRLVRYQEALAIWQRLVRPGEVRFQRELADAYNALGVTSGDPIKTLDAYQQSLAIREQLVALHPDDPVAHRDLGGSLNNIGVLLEQLGQPDQALPLYRRGVEQAEKAFAQAPQDLTNGRFLATGLRNCARVEEALGRPEEAVRLKRRVIAVWNAMARDNPAIPWIWGQLAYAHATQIQRLRATAAGRAEQEREADLAMDALRQAVALGYSLDDIATSGDPDLDPLKKRADLKALIAHQAAKRASSPSASAKKPPSLAAAASAQRPAMAPLADSAVSQENQAAAQHAIGLVLLDRGRLDAAAEHLARALSVRQRLVQGRLENLAYQMDLAATLVGLARLDHKAGRPERARPLWLQAASLLSRIVGQCPDDRQAWRELGIVRAELGEPESAATAFARLVELTPGPQRAAVLVDLATLEQKARRLEQSRRWWEKVLPIRVQAVAQRPDDLEAWRDLGIVHAELGQAEAAAPAFVKLMELTPETKDPTYWWSPDRAGIGAALANHDGIFGRVVQARPRDRSLLIARFHYFGRRRRWKEAAEMARRVTEINPSDEQARSYHLALLLLIGDVEGCRRATRERRAAGLKDDDELSIAAQFLGVSPVAQPRKPDPQTDVTVDEKAVPNQLTSMWIRGLRAYLDGRFADAVNRLHQVPGLTEHPFFLTKNGFVLAMALQQLGQVAEARREFEAARKGLDGLGRAFGWGDRSSAIEDGELMDYGWTERVIATVLYRVAEALILYDPIFPADPFAQ
jgi:serine/threonine protein kinase/tetratricopeptide (TPR) repeat protein